MMCVNCEKGEGVKDYWDQCQDCWDEMGRKIKVWNDKYGDPEVLRGKAYMEDEEGLPQ